METRTCATCSETKPITAYRNAGFGRHRSCIPCVTAKGQATKAAKAAATQEAKTPRPARTLRAPWEWDDTSMPAIDPDKLPAGWRST